MIKAMSLAQILQTDNMGNPRLSKVSHIVLLKAGQSQAGLAMVGEKVEHTVLDDFKVDY